MTDSAMVGSSDVGRAALAASGTTARWAVQMLAALVVAGLLLFLTAGRLNWMGGWVYLGMNVLTQVLAAIILSRRQPAMLAERTQMGAGTKRWDKALAPAIAIAGTFAVIITAGLDARFGWSAPIGAGLWGVALAVAIGSQLFVLSAMASNTFFATTVRIQTERAHSVVTTGPYRGVRHPGYLGSMLYTLAIPLVLGSVWTLVPALLTDALLVVRTGLEDHTLQTELPGYREYAVRVRYRLFPGVW
jgi:protein-S-isoprenylcysteine O-methyltransferase Ste14